MEPILFSYTPLLIVCIGFFVLFGLGIRSLFLKHRKITSESIPIFPTGDDPDISMRLYTYLEQRAYRATGRYGQNIKKIYPNLSHHIMRIEEDIFSNNKMDDSEKYRVYDAIKNYFR